MVTKCVENHSWPKIFDVFALMKTAPHRPPVASGGCHEGKIYRILGYREPRQSCFGAHTAGNRIRVSCASNAGTEKSLHPRRLSPLSRRDPKCAGNYLLPAAAEGQPQRSLPGGVRAVKGPWRAKLRPHPTTHRAKQLAAFAKMSGSPGWIRKILSSYCIILCFSNL